MGAFRNINGAFSAKTILLLTGTCLSLVAAGCSGFVSGKSSGGGNPLPLTISNVGAGNTTATNASISWQSSAPANSQVNFGVTASYGLSTAVDPPMVTSHQQTLSGLKPGTLYHFQVRSVDANNQAVASSDATFTTAADTNAPVVSIASPAAGNTLSATVSLTASATDDVAVANVQFKVDNANTGAPITVPPYTYALNTNNLSDGNHVLTAAATDTSGNTATSAGVAVKVNNSLPGPSLASLNPSSGVVGTSVMIAGANFGASQGTSTVKFGGTTATVTSWSTTSIVATVPTGAITGNVVVTVGGAASNGISFSVTTPAPSITSLNPTSGVVGTLVTIAGANFGAAQGTSTVKFNGTTGTATSWSATSIVATVPAGATTGNVVVTVGGVASNGVAFTVTTPTPSITSLNPTSGVVGTSVTIAGTNFGAAQGTSTVKFNGMIATATSWSSASIIAKVPAGATTGSVVITVGGVASNGVSFTVQADSTPPTVTLTAPSAGATLSGTVSVTANASDNVAVANVQFQLDGANLGSLDTVVPYSVSWNTTSASNGSHTLQVIATDTSNNSTTSSIVTVVVSNSTTTVAWPIKASANRRYLVDQNNVPFLLMGDAAHTLITSVSPADMATYMSTRAAQGFNAIQVIAPCDTYISCPASMASFSGAKPFTSGTSESNYDLSTPNPTYWAVVDNMFSVAASNNIVVFLNPMDTGGGLPLLETNGATKVFNFGVFLGNRYKNTPNLVWDFGNDFQNWNTNPTDNNLIGQLMAGIASVDSNHLMDIELDYDRSYSNQDTAKLASVLSLDAAYTYWETYDCVLAAYNSSPTLPVFMIEENYEGENNGSFFSGTTGPFILREQEYWTMTSGATGQFYGSHYTNHFVSGWQSNMNTPGALETKYVTQLFGSLPWWNLVPDQTHQIVTSGYGTYNASNGNLPAANYSTTAWVTDGSLAVVYNPKGNALTVNLAKFSGPVTARWYDPSNGTYTSITGSPFANSGSHVFSTPGANHDGNSDWVLVLE